MDMQEILQTQQLSMTRNPVQERRERQRYWLLMGIHERTGGKCDTPISCVEIGEAMDLTREETFRLIQSLAHSGYLDYVGAGPRVCITEKGIRHLLYETGRRRSIRDC